MHVDESYVLVVARQFVRYAIGRFHHVYKLQTSNEKWAKCPRDFFSTFFSAVDTCVFSEFSLIFIIFHLFDWNFDAAAQFHSNGEDELQNEFNRNERRLLFRSKKSFRPDLPCGASRIWHTCAMEHKNLMPFGYRLSRLRKVSRWHCDRIKILSCAAFNRRENQNEAQIKRWKNVLAKYRHV